MLVFRENIFMGIVSMSEPVKILYRGGTAEIIEKKSRFIADTAPVETEAEAAAFLEGIRKKYWDCRHHCSAYVIGDKAELTRCSDDGEPAGTAGRPILDMLLGSGIRNVCVVVSRYFGGTLLGTGGLVRAYSQAARAGLEASQVIEKLTGREVSVSCGYDMIGKLQYICAGLGLSETGSDYGETVKLSYLVPEEKLGQFRARVTEATAGRAVISESDLLEFAFADGDAVLF